MARGSKRGHRDWSRKHDASDADLTRQQGDPLAGEASQGEPIDLAAVQRDDALIDALSSGGDVPTANAEEYRLAALLAGWRAEVVDPAMPPGPTIDEVAAAVDAEIARSTAPKRSSIHLLRPIAGAAAAIAVVMAGLTVGSYNAQPGDPLWKVKEVVFTERANSTVASIDTTNNLEEAERMIRSGNSEGAMAVLESASKRVGAVSDASKRDQLNAWYDRLLADATSVLPVPPPLVPGAVTTLPAPIETTLPAVPPTTLPEVPTEVLVVPTAPPVTPPPSDLTGVPNPPVTTTPRPEIMLTPDPGSTGPVTSSPIVPTSQKATIATQHSSPGGTTG